MDPLIEPCDFLLEINSGSKRATAFSGKIIEKIKVVVGRGKLIIHVCFQSYVSKLYQSNSEIA